jgi:hypothetical protein
LEAIDAGMRDGGDLARRRGDGPASRRPSSLPRSRASSGSAFGMATPHLITLVLAAPGAFLELPLPTTALPLAPLLVVAAQAFGILLAREMELPAWRRVWLLLLTTTVVLMPLVALQASAARVPFVAVARGSAWTLVWSTVAAAVAVIALAGLAALLSADSPDQASLLFLPAALAVPTVLGIPGTPDEAAALRALVVVTGTSAVAAFVGWALTRGARPLVAPVALAAHFGLLWALGYGPPTRPEQGAVVPVLGTVLLVLTAVVTVFVPVAALAVRRLIRAARDVGAADAP